MIRSRRSVGTPPRGGTSRGECAQYSAQPCRCVGSTPRSHMATGLLMLHSCAGSRAANAGCAVLLSKRGVCVRRGCRCRGAAAVVCVRLCSRVIRSFISSPHAPRALRAPRFSSRRIKKLRVIFLVFSRDSHPRWLPQQGLLAPQRAASPGGGGTRRPPWWCTRAFGPLS